MKDAWRDKTPGDVAVVVVEWRDVRDSDDWTAKDEVRPCRHLSTLGWLLYDGPDPDDKGKNLLVLGRSYDAEEVRWSELVSFPRESVRRVVTTKLRR